MLEGAGVLAANGAWLAGGLPARARFERALGRPRAAQLAVLGSLLSRNAGSAFARQHGLTGALAWADFKAAVPARDYDGLRPWIERMLDGEPGVLTREPVLMFEKTSGSAAGAKYIPYTASLRREFQEALGAWISDLFLSRPHLLLGRSYWCVTPLGRERERTRGGAPIGFESDVEYLGTFERWVAQKVFAVPAAVAAAPDLETGLYVTLRFLLQAPDLALMSIWNPSFASIIIDALNRHAESLFDDLKHGTLRPPSALPPEASARLAASLQAQPARAGRLSALHRQGLLTAAEAWPRLALISCWGSAAAKLALGAVGESMPGVEVQPKGLLATEGVMTIPRLGLAGALPALTSHFLEFKEISGGDVGLVDELEAGGRYSVLLTTGGGLWRYDIGDVVRVVGFHGRVPLLEFEGRRDDVSDLSGEKLNATFVAGVIEALGAEGAWSGDFAMLAPSSEGRRYCLFVDGVSAEDLIARLESRLRANPQYGYARALGQLEAPRVMRVRGARAAFVRRCESLGQRAGAVKPAALDRRAGWEDWFEKMPSGAVR